MHVHQCPRCELRFAGRPEVAAHLVESHDMAPETVERRYGHLGRGVHPHRRPPDPTHVVHSDPHRDVER